MKDNILQTEKTRNIIYYIFAVALFAIIMYKIVKTTVCTLPSFDGALNYQVPVSLVQNGTYSTIFNGGTVFDEAIQSGGPFLFLIALVFRVFGIGATQALAVNAAFCILMFAGFFLINREIGLNRYLGLLALAVMAVTPYFWEYAFGGYGEIPTLAFLLWSVWALIRAEKKDAGYLFLLSGVLFGLAYLVKTVILIALPAIVLVFLVKLIRREMKLRRILPWILGLVLPIILFELYKMTQLGADAYIQFWQSQIVEILGQAGVSSSGEFTDTANRMEKLVLHLQTFSGYFKINFWINLVLLAVTAVHWMIRKIKDKTLRYYDILVLVAFSYYLWWTLITPTEKAWARRIIIGVLLMENSMFFWIDDGVRWLRERRDTCVRAVTFAASAVLLVCMGWKLGTEAKAIDATLKTAMKEDAAVIREIRAEDPEAQFYGFGWWQAPILSFLSEETFYNIYQGENTDDDNTKYLISDWYVNGLALDTLDELLSGLSTEEIYRNDVSYTVIYKIDNSSFE